MKIKFLYLTIAILFLGACSDKEETIIVPKPIENNNTYLPKNVRPILEEQQHNAFKFFYDGASPTGLTLEGSDRGDVITIGGTGFGLMSLIVGSERGWITREQAAAQTLKIVTFLRDCKRIGGAWAHWYKPDGTIEPFGNQIEAGDLVETGLLTAGLLTASEYYTSGSTDENNIRSIVEQLWNTIDWNLYTNNMDALFWLYGKIKNGSGQIENNVHSLPISGWNEAWNSYIFALAAPAPHNISPQVYAAGWQHNGTFNNSSRKFYGYNLPVGPDKGGPMFLDHYSFLGFNPKKLQDNYLFYWDQCVGHTMINRHYCLYEAKKEYKYNESNWGLTACYGAGSEYGYKARSPQNDDGVIAPTAALGSYPYTPFYSTQVLLNLYSLSYLKGKYGFGDSYRPMENAAEKKHLAIDQGPIVVMIENYRTGLIWNLLMKNEHVKKGLEIAGMKSTLSNKEGFYLAIVNTQTNVYDMMIHPDREKYELDYFVNSVGTVKFEIIDSSDKQVLNKDVTANIGENIFSFFDESILRGKKYQINMTTADNKKYTINTILR